jgi:hypothetical protein
LGRTLILEHSVDFVFDERNKGAAGSAEVADPRHTTSRNRPGPFVDAGPRANGVGNAMVLHRQVPRGKSFCDVESSLLMQIRLDALFPNRS